MGDNIFDILPKNKDKESTLFNVGISAIMFGALTKTWLPDEPILAYGSYVLGGLTILIHFLDKIENKWEELFKACNMKVKSDKSEKYPILLNKKKTNYGYILKFKAPIGITTKDFEKNQRVIEEMLKKRVEIAYNNFIFVKVYEKDLQTYYPFKQFSYNKVNGVKFCIGYGYKGPVDVTLDDSHAHLLIAGETGSGKSVLLRSIVISIMFGNPQVNIHLIDLKNGAEFGMFKYSNRIKSFSRNADEAKRTLRTVIKEVDRRYNLFFENNCANITSYNKKAKANLKREVVIIDEFAELSEEKGRKNTSVNIVERLARIARACGIHLIPCTQRIDAETINGRIRANIGTIIGLKHDRALNSRITIDEDGLEKLRGKGHGKLKINGELIEFQGMDLSDDDEAISLIKHTYIKETKKTKKVLKSKKKEKIGEIKDFSFLFEGDIDDK